MGLVMSVGQIGCGKEHGLIISKPILLKYFQNIYIKSIYCSFLRSFALTTNGLVYSWGWNDWCVLGHELDKEEIVFEPKLINISNVISVCPSSNNTYFLTNEGLIYFCGYYKDENNCESFQKLPKLIEGITRFSSLHSVTIYQKQYSIASAVSENSILYLNFNKIMKTESKDILEYYCKEWNVCHKTIQICDDFNYKESELLIKKTLSEMNSRFEEMFTHLNKLGQGGFGVVYRSENKFNKKLYALKKISTESKKNLFNIKPGISKLA